MDEERIFLVSEIPGFTPQIGRLVSMMNYARWSTLKTVEGLTEAELDYLYDEDSNSIGALLRHIAAVEFIYQVNTFENRNLSGDEKKEWDIALNLGEGGREKIRGHSLEQYIKWLDDVRDKTLSGFAERDDEWLNEERPFWGGKPANNWFKWFHVFEDELNHRGQTRWLRKRLSPSK